MAQASRLLSVELKSEDVVGRNHIICNSTFSWWGAWLNPRKNKTVIVPSRWFMKEETPYIYPARWIKVPIN
jgi:hypothetical protein